MGPSPTDIAMLCIIFILLLLSAFFSSAETALTTVSSVRVRMLIDEGNKRALTLDKVLDNKSKMLSTILIANNIVNLSASALATIFTQNVFGNIYASIGVGILTLVIIVFGEIIPKTAAHIQAEKYSLRYAGIINSLMILFTPIIIVLNIFSKGFLSIFRIKTDQKDASITEDEVKTIMDMGQEEGIFENDTVDIVKNIFDFGDTTAKDIMVPKVEVTMVSADATYAEVIEAIHDGKHTRIPVYKDNDDHVIGILNIKDLIINQINESNFNMSELIREPYFTIATKDLDDLLSELKNEDAGMAIVLDEYGAVDGIITLEDILEEIVGDLKDEFDEEENLVVRQVGENEYIVEGSINLDDFNEELNTEIDSENYESLGGLIIEELDRVPKKGDSVTVDNCTLTVIKMEGNRIDYVKVEIVPKEDSDEEDSQK